MSARWILDALWFASALAVAAAVLSADPWIAADPPAADRPSWAFDRRVVDRVEVFVEVGVPADVTERVVLGLEIGLAEVPARFGLRELAPDVYVLADHRELRRALVDFGEVDLDEIRRDAIGYAHAGACGSGHLREVQSGGA